MAMAPIPTEYHVKALQSVEESSTGIDAVSNRDDGLECVKYGWLEHREHRREEGGVIDVWGLTREGREVLRNRTRTLNRYPAVDDKAA
jgi:hypothetical protein